ncbi:MAG: ankyrin repeat domain-containing protein [Gammaproteobacteria bacterium]
MSEKEVNARIAEIFSPTSLKEFAKDVELQGLGLMVRVTFNKKTDDLTKSEENEVFSVLKKLGIQPEKIFFGCAFMGGILKRGPEIFVQLELSVFLETLKKNPKFDETPPSSESHKPEHVDPKPERRKSSDKNSENFSSWAGMFPGSKQPEDLISKLVKAYDLKNTSQSELERGLREAAANKNGLDLQKFIELKVNVNAQDPILKKTALHLAIGNNSFECVKILLLNGANNSIKDASGKIPSDYCSGAEPKIFSLLFPDVRSCLIM